jgi:hypothetical protein
MRCSDARFYPLRTPATVKDKQQTKAPTEKKVFGYRLSAACGFDIKNNLAYNVTPTIRSFG